MIAVSFVDFLPIPRYDGDPWTQVTIEEAPAVTGPWTVIDTITFQTVDADPTNPQPKSFTTENATIFDGWYRLTFSDAEGTLQQPVDPIHNVADVQPEFWPTVTDVATLLRTRTVDRQGNEGGTFTSDTRPTAAQVAEIIKQAALDLSAQIGPDIPDDLIPEARRIVAIRAAMLVELTYFPEQVAASRSPYAEYRQLWLDAIGTSSNPGQFVLTVRAEEEGDTPGATSGMAQFSFPSKISSLVW
jgi:hypothetical protein